MIRALSRFRGYLPAARLWACYGSFCEALYRVCWALLIPLSIDWRWALLSMLAAVRGAILTFLICSPGYCISETVLSIGDPRDCYNFVDGDNQFWLAELLKFACFMSTFVLVMHVWVLVYSWWPILLFHFKVSFSLCIICHQAKSTTYDKGVGPI